MPRILALFVVLLLSVLPARAQTGFETNLVLWMELDDADDSHGDYSFDINGSAQFVSGLVGNALQAGRSPNRYLSLSSQSGLYPGTEDFAVSAWINASALDAPNGYQTFLSYGGDDAGTPGFHLTQRNDANLWIYYSDGSTRSNIRLETWETGSTITAGNWIHVVVNFDRDDSMVLFVNGTQVDATLLPDRTSPVDLQPSSNFMIGDGWLDAWNGLIDEVGYWVGYTLTQDDIDALYNGGEGAGYQDVYAVGGGGVQYDSIDPSSPQATNLIRLWSALSSSSTGTTLNDLVAGDDMTLVGSPSYVPEATFGRALELSGTGEYAVKNSRLFSGFPFTVFAVFRPHVVDNFGDVFSQFQSDRNSNLILGGFDEDGEGNPTLLLAANDGAWTGIMSDPLAGPELMIAAFVFESASSRKLYIYYPDRDPAIFEEKSTTVSYSLNFNNQDRFEIGRTGRPDAICCFDGEIIEVRAYSSSMSFEDFQAFAQDPLDVYAVGGGSGSEPSDDGLVPLYGVFEKPIINNGTYTNPFDYQEIELQATFTSPSSNVVNFFGFYDGDGSGGQTGNVWKLRFMPDEVGTWTYTYSWTDGTPGGAGFFDVIDTDLPGPLRIASDNPWYWEDSRGNPFDFYGYDLHIMGWYSPTDKDYEGNIDWILQTYQERLVTPGFNFVMIEGLIDRLGQSVNTWADSWWLNTTDTDIYDLAVFHAHEQILDLLHENEIYGVHFAAMTHQQAIYETGFDKFIRYWVARFGPYYNLFGWSPTWEWQDVLTASEVDAIMQQADDWNPFPTMLSAHDCSDNSFVGWLDFSMRQHQSRTLQEANTRDAPDHGCIGSSFVDMPILGSEDHWEGDGAVGTPQNRDEVRRGMWGAMLAGVMPLYSEWNTVLGGNGTAVGDVHNLFDFVYSHTNYRQWEMKNALVSGTDKACSGITGEEYIVYDENGGTITIDLTESPGATFDVTWYDPANGVIQSGGSVQGGASRNITSPFGTGDSVLLLTLDDSPPPPTGPTIFLKTSGAFVPAEAHVNVGGTFFEVANIGGGGGPVGGDNALLDGLVAWWDLDEASGTRADAHGSFDLTDNGGVLSAPGKIGNAADFTVGNVRLTNDAAGLHPGSGSFSVATWVRYDGTDAPGDIMLVTMGANGANDSYKLNLETPAFGLSPDFTVRLTNETNYTAIQEGALAYSTGTFHLIVGKFDREAKEVGISVDGGAFTTVPTADADLHAKSFPTTLGAHAFPGGYHHGLLDATAIWHRALSDEDVAALWNDGNGVSYADISGGN